ITRNGSFTLATKYAQYTSYAVVAYTQPSGQTCRVAGGVGTIVNNNVSNIAISCQ
ncbi:MAG: 3-carboxymuconate cyclase, partial [Parcubacteria group bacterium GW2011_GWA2_43_11]